MPFGNLVESGRRFPLASRPFIQQSSMLTYTYPAAAMLLDTIASAIALISESLGLQLKVFHEFQPMGGVAASTVEPPVPPAPPVPVLPPLPPAPPAPAAPPVPVAPPLPPAPPVAA